MFGRQNDERAIIYLKAAMYNSKKEKSLKIFMIIFTLSICLLGIFNKYFSFIEMIPFVKNQDDPGQAASLILAFISGAGLIIEVLASERGSKIRADAATLFDMYDTYVYSIPANKLLTNDITQVSLENWAMKVKDKKGYLKNYYFDTHEECEGKNPAFDNLYNYFITNYKMLLYARNFFFTIWIIFAALLTIISASFNDTFIRTLAHVFLPSLGIILMIINSIYRLNIQTAGFHNGADALRNIKKANAMGMGEENLNSKLFLRSILDSVYSRRSCTFLVPSWLATMFFKQEERKQLLSSLEDSLKAEGIMKKKIAKKKTQQASKKAKKVAKVAKKPEQKPAAKPEQKQAKKPEAIVNKLVITPSKPAASSTVKPAKIEKLKPIEKPKPRAAEKPKQSQKPTAKKK